MKRQTRLVVAAVVSALAFASKALAFPIAAPGTECLKLVVSSTDPIIATYQGNSAAYSNDLYLVLDAHGQPGDDGNPGNDLFLFNNHASQVGSTVDLGSYPVGTELIFRLFVNDTGYSYATGPASRNPDGHCHARAQAGWSPGETLVSFEDLFDGPFEYNDLSFSFTNTASHPITLSPIAATNPVGTSHTVTATVENSAGGPLVGTTVVFAVRNGPNGGIPGTCTTNADCSTDAMGQVSFTYTGNGGEGTDTIGACFVDQNEVQFCAQEVTKTWTSATCTEGQPCDDGDPCTSNDTCTGGACHGSPLVCAPVDDCHLAGSCEPSTGQCTTPTADDGTGCNDGDACTQSDTCEAGVCVGSDPVECTVEGACLAPGTCDPSSGACSEPVPAPDGTPCGTDGVCAGGACNHLPSCAGAAPSIGTLWPPNHHAVGVDILGVTDAGDDPVTFRITGIEQDEPVRGAGSGSTCPDGGGEGTSAAWLRAERSGTGDGRVYHVRFEAVDSHGGTCTGEVTVCVPHDLSARGAVCGDGGPIYDSAGDCGDAAAGKATAIRPSRARPAGGSKR